ncbi:checkpoint protein HUS1 isoform X2 [Cylas formicarius]|uniref:checkpoint protein HUS1 isoform X2 n=1 Tax=Cylas formicarius TaxID=197179 RepID=UPI002958A6D8|nr:checkpoint protein HUS1 isoform X2 [Cylas formicarius]
MKFRALMTENPAMREFLNISLSLTRFAKSCILRLTSTKLFFIISEEERGPRRPLVWCELPVSFYFKEYNIVGVSEVHNEIYLELSTVLLSRSCSLLKQEIKSFKIKLTNKESPCLTLEMEMVAGETLSRQYVHDIPVEIISRKHWADYEEPNFSDFHVSIEMPNLKSIKNIVERMRNMSHSLIVNANRTGKLTLQIKTNIVDLSAHFPNLNVESFADHISNNLEESGAQEGSVVSTIDLKKFLMFLTGMQLTNCRATCSIIHRKMVKLFLEEPGALSLQIFLSELSV